MPKFDLSKLLDYLSRCGKCIIKIQIGNMVLSEIDLQINEDGGFNLSDDKIKQLIAILYGKTYTDDGAILPIEDNLKKISLSNTLIILLDRLMLDGYSFDINIEPQEVKTIRPIKCVHSVHRLTRWVSQMVKYVNPFIVGNSLNISIMGIYNGIDDALKSDEEICDIDEELNKRRRILHVERASSESTISFLQILVGIQNLSDENNVTGTAIDEILRQYHYDELDSDAKSQIRYAIEYIKEDYESGDYTFGGLS